MAPYFTPQTTLTTDQGGLAWTLSQADSKLHTTLGQSCQPREAKLFPQDQASSPGGFTTLCLEKKGAAGIDKFKDCTPCPPAALRPKAFLPDHFQGINCPLPPGLQQGGETVSPLYLLLSLPSSFHTNQGLPQPTQERHTPRRSGRGQGPLLQQAALTAWPGVSLSFPLGDCWPSQRSFPQDNSPKS